MGLLQIIKKPRSWAISCMFLLLLLQLGSKSIEASRTLREDKWVHDHEGLWLASLPRKTTPPSHSSPCTFVPGGKKGGKCTLRLKEMHVAGPGLNHGGHAHHLGFPSHVIQMGPATIARSQNDVVLSGSPKWF